MKYLKSNYYLKLKISLSIKNVAASKYGISKLILKFIVIMENILICVVLIVRMLNLNKVIQKLLESTKR